MLFSMPSGLYDPCSPARWRVGRRACFLPLATRSIQSIVWWGPAGRSVWSADYPWGVPPEYVEMDQRQLQQWGTLEGARIWAEGEALYGRAFSEEEIRAYAELSRHTATPDVARDWQGSGTKQTSDLYCRRSTCQRCFSMSS